VRIRHDTEAVHRHASVTVEAAAELVNVDAATIRRWSESGSVQIERQGDMEVVRLDQLHLASAYSRREHTSTQRGGLRGRLEGATIDDQSVSALQELARDRADRPDA
jgi:phage terminase Nu1 subunit (DNA packaging protein)